MTKLYVACTVNWPPDDEIVCYKPAQEGIIEIN